MRCLGRVKLVRRNFCHRCIDVLHCASNNGLNNNEVRNGFEQCGDNAYKMIITTMLFEQILARYLIAFIFRIICFGWNLLSSLKVIRNSFLMKKTLSYELTILNVLVGYINETIQFH